MVESVVESQAETVIDSTEKKIRVLHVDDELALLKVAKQCLEMQGPFRVDTASSVRKALAKLEKERYDAVVSDYQMPGKDGLEFLKELRESGNSVPFIMFTGKGREEVAIRALNLGANQYLNKTGETETVYTELAHTIAELAKTKKAEELLRLSEERYRNLFENAKDVIILFDLKGNVTSANKGAEEYGFNKNEILGKNMLKFVFKRYWPKLLKDIAQIALGKTAEGRIEIHTPKGDKIAEYKSNPIFSDNRVVGIQTILEDTTEHKKAEETLRESEEKYRNLFESAMDAIVTLDLKGSITAVNSSVLRFGYEKEDLVGKNILDFVSKEYWPAVIRDFSKVAQGEPAKNEVELAVPAGKILVEYHAGAIVKENNVAGVQINIRDVTERKKSEELLRESEERFRGLFESIQDPVGIFVGKEGHLIDYNTAFKKSSGYTDEELKGKVFLDFVHPDDRAMVLEKYQTEYSEDKFPMIYEIRGVNKKGECIPLELSVSTYKKKGKVIGIEVIHRDLTERKKAEMSLRESQGRFEGLFQGNPEAAAYLGPDYHIQDVNPRFEKLFGYSLEEVEGKHINDVVVPDDRREEGETLDRDARKGYVYRNTVRRKKDGSLVQVSVSAAPIANESGVTGIVAMYKDISDLKNAEKRMDVMNEKLRVVGGLTRHDIRNKLAAVTGNAYLLRKRFASEPNAIECLESIETAVRESGRIFDFASAYEKLGVEQLVYVDAKKILEEAIAMFPDLKGVRIVNDCDGLTLLADSLLRQLFYNLIDNSLKYCQKATQIRIHYEKAHDNELRLAYEDDGIGISKDTKPKLFTEGFTTGKGSGHGLYLIRKMMDVYGWTIDETGEPGKGARFTINIPETKPDGTRNYRLQ
jgi:PAS domain S-box-containing protein